MNILEGTLILGIALIVFNIIQIIKNIKFNRDTNEKIDRILGIK